MAERKEIAIPARLLIGGTHAGGSGYPNAWHTLHLLERAWGIRSIECGSWLPEGAALWRLARKGPVGWLRHGLGLAAANLLSVLRTLYRASGRASWVYVPYPAVFFLWWMSWVPRFLRPRIIADAYISVWDAWYRDRASAPTRERGAWLKALERRALAQADWVLTDTEANRGFYVETFGLDSRRVRALPLAIDEGRFLSLPLKEKTEDEVLTVLFIGTMIPLHGIDVILEAIGQTEESAKVRYRLIGDGQQGVQIARFLEHSGRRDVTWVKAWQSLAELAREIGDADLCLGIFGGTPKSSRVLPFKIYLYLAAAKPVITQDAYSLPEGLPAPPLVTIPARDPGALADAMRALCRDPALRARLGQEGRAYFQRHLGSVALLERWRRLLASAPEEELPSPGPRGSGPAASGRP